MSNNTGLFGTGRYRPARVQRFQARNSAQAKLAAKRKRKAARRARARAAR